MRAALALLTVALAAPAGALPPVRSVTDLTRGLRHSPPFLSIAEAPSDPKVLYVGDEWGRVNVTRDGGQSWEEVAVLTPRGKFYGAIRPAPPPGRLIETSLSAPDRVSPSNLFDPTFDASGNFEGPELTAASDLLGDLLSRESDGPGGGGAGGGARLGVGLRNTAPWLAIAVRKKSGWGVGLRLKQTLSLRGGAATSIRFIDVDPRDPNVAIAATSDGILKTTDGGYSWPVVATGALPDQRSVHFIQRHPRDPDVVYAPTSLGLLRSENAGDTWAPMVHGLVSINDTRWIAFDPRDPQTFYVGLSWALVKTTDGGTNFDIVFTHPWPAAAKVRRIVVDPHDSKRVFMGTADGLFLSEDAGQTWDRTGGFVLTGADIVALAAGPEPGHFLTAEVQDLWETRDGGKTWQVAYFGSIAWWVRWAAFSKHDPKSVWILTSAEVLRMSERPARSLPRRVVEAYRERVASEPTANEVVQSALRRFGVDRPTVNAMRRRASIAGLLPDVTAVGWQRSLDLPATRLIRGRDVLDTFDRFYLGDVFNWAVFASWDLAEVLHSGNEAPTDRVGYVSRDLEYYVRQTAINLYQERRRLMLEELAEPGSARARLMRALRLEELTAHLNALSGDLLPPAPAL